MGVIKDMLGLEFGKLKVLEYVGKDHKNQALWKCECSCPNHTIVIVRGSDLRSGNTTTCGCGRIDGAKKANTTHGLRYNDMYHIWKDMLYRCNNPSARCYNSYGGRGISVCDDWSDPNTGIVNFVNWGNSQGYQRGLTIDRIDVNGNYEPGNCRWVTNEEQQINRRDTIRLQDGTPLIVYCREHNLNYNRIYSRIYNGMSLEKALTKPKNKYYTNDGTPLSDYCKQHDIDYRTVLNRMYKGRSLEEAIKSVLETKE